MARAEVGVEVLLDIMFLMVQSVGSLMVVRAENQMTASE